MKIKQTAKSSASVSFTEAELVLKKADGKDIAIPAAEIERSVPQQKSLMPDLLLRDLTPQQAADLLEYLISLQTVK